MLYLCLDEYENMSYRNKTYVIFDGDDIISYRLMLAWRANQYIDFNFYDAHEVRDIRRYSGEESVKRGLRERFQTAKQAIVLVGEHTKYLYKYVRWEIDVAQELQFPVIVANLNQKRIHDTENCPPILRGYYAVHVSFQPKIIKHALDQFPDEFFRNKNNLNEDKIRIYGSDIYRSLDL